MIDAQPQSSAVVLNGAHGGPSLQVRRRRETAEQIVRVAHPAPNAADIDQRDAGQTAERIEVVEARGVGVRVGRVGVDDVGEHGRPRRVRHAALVVLGVGGRDQPADAVVSIQGGRRGR